MAQMCVIHYAHEFLVQPLYQSTERRLSANSLKRWKNSNDKPSWYTTGKNIDNKNDSYYGNRKFKSWFTELCCDTSEVRCHLCYVISLNTEVELVYEAQCNKTRGEMKQW